MNDNMVDSLTKLASELTDRVEVLENDNKALAAENADLKTKLADAQQTKQAAAQLVDEATVNASIDALIKVGALKEEQRQASHDRFMSDPTAAHRVLVRVLDAQSQTKTARAADDTDDLRGGRLANVPKAPEEPDRRQACQDRMCKILGLG